jgi:hypothetical protein
LYRQLNANKIVQTSEKLQKRIQERFPSSGLSAVAEEVCSVARSTAERSEQIAKTYIGLRIGVVMFTLLLVLLGVNVAATINFGPIANSLSDFLQALDATLEAIVLCSGGIVFLLTLETRFKRRKALKAIHELRSLAHVIDMHQLTKDPDRVMQKVVSTPSSPKHTLDAPALTRYLDYCSEMLSILSKIAALYAQALHDPVVLEAVDEIESLTNNLSRKIWQKITIVNGMKE